MMRHSQQIDEYTIVWGFLATVILRSTVIAEIPLRNSVDETLRKEVVLPDLDRDVAETAK